MAVHTRAEPRDRSLQFDLPGASGGEVIDVPLPQDVVVALEPLVSPKELVVLGLPRRSVRPKAVLSLPTIAALSPRISLSPGPRAALFLAVGQHGLDAATEPMSSVRVAVLEFDQKALQKGRRGLRA